MVSEIATVFCCGITTIRSGCGLIELFQPYHSETAALRESHLKIQVSETPNCAPFCAWHLIVVLPSGKLSHNYGKYWKITIF